MSNVTIRDVRAICTAPRGIDLVVVKVETSEPGLYGIGCATFTQRWWALAETVEKYMNDTAKALGGKVEFVDAVRFEKGEGIEKKEENFAAEIASMVKG